MDRPTQPAEIAREAIRLLASRRKPPTPENFQRAYREVAGAEAEVTVDDIDGTETRPEANWATLMRGLVKQWDSRQAGLTQTRKREMLERVLINFGNNSPLLHEKLTALTHSWAGSGTAENLFDDAVPEPPDAAAGPVEAGAPASDAPALVSTLADHLRQLADTCDPIWPELAQRAGALSRSLSGLSALSPEQFESWSALWREILMRAEDDHELSAGLKRLVGLLFLNIGELVGDEAWLSGQLAAMQNVMAGDLQAEALLEAERSLRELAYKQGVIKGSLDEAKAKLKTLITTFIDHIGEMSRSTDGYHARIGEYSERISQASDITELGDVVEGLSADVTSLRDALGKSHAELVAARGQAEDAQARVHELELELAQVSNLLREDQLTGALNRRGMEEALARELARSERMDARLSVGLLDIDHFKKLNDTLGHQAGDEALRHLAQVVKALLRPTDTLARYGGEEFLILLPNTGLEEAAEVLKRVQRALTKQFFLHDNERVLITFSAGVAERQGEEGSTAIVARADAAMYRAKQSGRNRVEMG
ncbi:MAG: diguanylate cyclase [Thiobacillus sp.]|nr:diguanylate cyclase [Thiobacillus sp.]